MRKALGLLAFSALALAGCGSGSGPSPSEAQGVKKAQEATNDPRANPTVAPSPGAGADLGGGVHSSGG